ncbi:hypothetical protein C9374_012132 [Naegleria lovaniensis]|uniref:Glycosyltransferase 61 catalytic domain-containing protein n=1 Tax=Naegleria lovaniensis TaxID=51637 RepID=A0AA88GEI0_NAELO|nr:uncharacterized protein C9374_012132 [Naegleria lovaniensis]KAG2373393.1 hypothetical protein C9374_012132 [Naegleria lovaniensis]
MSHHTSLRSSSSPQPSATPKTHFLLVFILLLAVAYTIGNVVLFFFRDQHRGTLPSSLLQIQERFNSSCATSGYPNTTKFHRFVRVDQLLHRYEPPKIPTIFQSLEYRPVGNDMADPNCLPNSQSFYRASTSLFHSSSLESKHLLQSHHHCIIQREWNRERSNIPFTSCKFENICMNRRGEWIIYTNSPKDHAMSGKAWVHTGAYHPISLYIRVEKPPTLIVKHNGQVLTKANTHKNASNAVMVLSERFKWISTPTLVFTRHAMGNLGHAWLDNYLPLFNLMMIFEYVHRENHILFLDFEQPHVDQVSFIFSNKPALQKCVNENGTFIAEAPCFFSTPRQEELDKIGNQIDTCFSSVLTGNTGSFFKHMERRDHILPAFRNYLLNRLKIPYSKFLERQKTLVIAIQNKPLHSNNKDSIINVDQIVTYLTQRKTQILNEVNHFNGNAYENIEIVNFKLESMSLAEQIEFFTTLNVYVTTQGSASYMSLFMYNPNAVMIYVPFCLKETLMCSDVNIRVHETFSNVRIISLMNHLHLVQCVTENSVQAQGFPVKPLNFTFTDFKGDCHERVDPEGLQDLIIQSLQREL